MCKLMEILELSLFVHPGWPPVRSRLRGRRNAGWKRPRHWRGTRPEASASGRETDVQSSSRLQPVPRRHGRNLQLLQQIQLFGNFWWLETWGNSFARGTFCWVKWTLAKKQKIPTLLCTESDFLCWKITFSPKNWLLFAKKTVIEKNKKLYDLDAEFFG